MDMIVWIEGLTVFACGLLVGLVARTAVEILWHEMARRAAIERRVARFIDEARKRASEAYRRS